MKPMQDAHYLKQVREQYEQFPYPPRDPEQERTQFIYEHLSALSSLSHYHYRGRHDFSKGYRALVAGGGTGDSIIMLGEQLRGSDAEIVYLDISEASMDIAKRRAEVRRLDNITWVHGSILDARRLLEGEFDYINCSGVLHHLESPEEGLAVLASLLKTEGVMALLLYARYGRESVYQIQKLMRLLEQGEEDLQRKVDDCKAVLRSLPPTHSFHQLQSMIADLKDDIGIYDLFLHSHDVAYSVPEIYRFLAAVHLKPTHFFFVGEPNGNGLYDPLTYLAGSGMEKKLEKLTLADKQAAAELLHGRMIKHMFYAARADNTLPQPNDLEMVPYLTQKMRREAYGELLQLVRAAPVGQMVSLEAFGLKTGFIKTSHAEALFERLDGIRSIGDILKDIRLSAATAKKKPGMDELLKEFGAIYAAFNRMDWMYLRHSSTVPILDIFALHSRQNI